MLSLLTIDNIALISHGEISFSNGFVVLTGETGAGKSIIIDSISLILGARANKDLIRSGEDRAQVEAIFENFNDIELRELSKIGIDVSDGQLMLAREIYSDGRTVARINGKAVTVAMLRAVASKIVNIHGQHECQILTDSHRHIELLDLYAENKAELEAYTAAYEKAKAIQRRLLELKESENEKNGKIDYLKFIVDEIDKVAPQKGELEMLTLKKENVERDARYNEGVNAVISALNGTEDTTGALANVKTALKALDSVKELVYGGDEMYERLCSVCEELSDMTAEFSHLKVGDGAELNDIDKIEERLYLLEQLCNKYGGNLDAVIKTREDALSQLSGLENSGDLIKELSEEYLNSKKVLLARSKELSATRHKASEKLCAKVCEALSFLDMPGVRFYTKFEDSTNAKGGLFFTPSGTEKMEFMISANMGEQPKPLAKIASGGELSRIILAIKSALNEKEGTGTLIFDEIDTGVSGKTSYKIGMKLQRASISAQVFCVTHSAQIASLADMHIKVSKSTVDGRSYTVATELSKEQRVMELARIMGGDIISKTLLDSAKELIAQSNEIKRNSL